MLTILRISAIIVCLSAVLAQESATESGPESISAVQVLDTPGISALQNLPQLPKQDQIGLQIEALPKIEQDTNNNQENKVPLQSKEESNNPKQEQQKREEITAEATVDDIPISKQAATKDIRQEGDNAQRPSEVKPTLQQNANKQIEPDVGSLQNLTEQQQKQMLLQQSLRAQLHENKQLNLADLANLTPEQQKRMEQRFAEEARIAHERALKQISEREARQQQQMVRLLRETQLSYTQKIKGQERLKRMEFMKIAPLESDSSEVMFELDPFVEEDFLITLLVEQNIALLVSIYSNQNGVYTRKENIQKQQPMKIFIYENYNRLIYQDSFYFTNAFSFKGEPHSTYTIRYQNSDIHRLVSAKMSNVLSTSNLKSAIKTEDVAIHARKTNEIWTSLRNRFKEIGTSATIQLSNKKQLRERIEYYFYYNIVELVIFAIVVLLQLKLIKRLFNSSSVV